MSSKTGILLVNLGSPSAPTTKAVRAYLKQFLSDRRIVSLPPLFWQPVLHGIILRTRPAKSARNYEKIWRRVADGRFADVSPLLEITGRQAEKLSYTLGGDTPVEIAMRYGQPDIYRAMQRLLEQGCTQIGVLSLYPQYAGATVGSVYDDVVASAARLFSRPTIKLLRDYHDEEVYIKAVSSRVQKHIDGLDWKPDVLVCSFHGLPVKQIERGDSYLTECEHSFELITEQLSGLAVKNCMAFQSRFGPAKWLEPSTKDTLVNLVQSGQKKVVVYTPGFAADSLETLEEIALQARDIFLAAGGSHFSLVPCLNDCDEHINGLSHLVEKYLLEPQKEEGNLLVVGANASNGMC